WLRAAGTRRGRLVPPAGAPRTRPPRRKAVSGHAGPRGPGYWPCLCRLRGERRDAVRLCRLRGPAGAVPGFRDGQRPLRVCAAAGRAGHLKERGMEASFAEADVRPWELAGAIRRDCEPHRGHRLVVLGTVSLVCGILAFCLFLPGFVGLPLGLAVRGMANRDLELMRQGLMDRTGWKAVEKA